MRTISVEDSDIYLRIFSWGNLEGLIKMIGKVNLYFKSETLLDEKKCQVLPKSTLMKIQ